MRACLLAGVLSVGLLAGCSKVVTLTVTNNLSSRADMDIQGPFRGSSDFGCVTAGGGRVTYDLVIPRKELPAVLNFQAGPYSFEYTVSSQTESPLWLEIGPDGVDGPRPARYPTYP